MSIWVRVFCKKSVATLTPEDLADGIGRRVGALTYLLLPEDEEDPAAVVDRMEVLTEEDASEFVHAEIAYRVGDDRPIQVERWFDRKMVEEEVSEALDELGKRTEPEAQMVRERVQAAIETIGFELKLGDAKGMGWPVSLGAACEVCARGEGVVYAEGLGWVEPTGIDLRVLLPES